VARLPFPSGWRLSIVDYKRPLGKGSLATRDSTQTLQRTNNNNNRTNNKQPNNVSNTMSVIFLHRPQKLQFPAPTGFLMLAPPNCGTFLTYLLDNVFVLLYVAMCQYFCFVLLYS